LLKINTQSVVPFPSGNMRSSRINQMTPTRADTGADDINKGASMFTSTLTHTPPTELAMERPLLPASIPAALPLPASATPASQMSTAGSHLSAEDVVAMLHGSPQIILSGFGNISVPTWVPELSLSNANQPILPGAHTIKSSRPLQNMAWLLFFVATLSLIYSLYLQTLPNKFDYSHGQKWYVQSINGQALKINLGGAPLEIPVGGTLPNGQSLRSVSYASKSYTTNAGAFQIATIDSPKL
jgi:hypothetical protein